MAYIPFFANPLSGGDGGYGNPLIRGSYGEAEPDDAQERAQAARKKLFDMAEGRLGELRSDEVDRLVLDGLRQRSGTGAGPYDAETVNALRTGAADQAAQVERNALSRIQGSAGDPSTQSQIAEAQAARQAAIQRANLDISQRANAANYDARGQALGQLAGFNMARNNQITDQTNRVGNLVASEQFKGNAGGYGTSGGNTAVSYSRSPLRPR